LTNDGKVYILAGGFADNSFTKKPGTFNYYFYNYNHTSDELIPVKLDAGDHFLTNLGLTTSSDGKSPLLAGLYSDKNTLKVQGVASFNMGSAGILEGHFTPLDDGLLKTLYEDAGTDKDQADEYDVRYIFPESNGDVTFFAEHYSRKLGVGVDVSLFRGVEPKPQLEDHYGNIVVARVSRDGSPVWTNIIEKQQKSTDENIMFNSFAVAKKDDAYGLVFNDQVKNMSDVVWVTINNDGSKDRKLIFERTKDRLRVAPMLAGDDHSGDLFLPAVRFSKTKLVRIKF
ncbi:MAG TPA: hypothetical protein VE870_15195, partial [Bacteroidales bacterium]|nr:hypothetical protein [Bacteroidales bacterium]